MKIKDIYDIFSRKYDADDAEAFRMFAWMYLDNNAKVRSICMQCDLSDTQWKCLQMKYHLPKSVLIEKKDRISWDDFLGYENLDDEIVYAVGDRINFACVVSMSKKVTEKCLSDHADRIPFDILSKCRMRRLSEDFIEKYKDRFDWHELTHTLICQKRMDVEFLTRFADRIDFEAYSKYGVKTNEIIERFKDRFDWEILSLYHDWDIEGIRRFDNLIDWNAIKRLEGNYADSLDKLVMKREKALALK